ncbi:hypothetical protein BgiMline_012536 [Biomphalaria glabrata]|nr:hypothetical protein BgiMline_016418 [Biomphalaria glabrata]
MQACEGCDLSISSVSEGLALLSWMQACEGCDLSISSFSEGLALLSWMQACEGCDLSISSVSEGLALLYWMQGVTYPSPASLKEIYFLGLLLSYVSCTDGGGSGRDEALAFTNMRHKLPAGGHSSPKVSAFC